MAKYFLGSVGTAEAFRMVTGKDGKKQLQLAFVSKTLTDSGLNISTTKDDLRAGTGAGIVASFYHDASVEITLTDVMFKTEYVEAQLGADFVGNGSSYKSTKKPIVCETEGEIDLEEAPENLPFACEGNTTIVWYTPEGKDDWKSAPVEALEPTKVKGDFAKGVSYCVRYLAKDDAARVAEITSNMIPQELFLIITAPIFAGDACSASNGAQAGYIQFEVPRFRLNGAQDFAMNMSSNQTMSLSGSALASESGCDVNGSKLLRIIEVILDRKWDDDVVELVIDSEVDPKQGETPEIFAVGKNGAVYGIDNSKLKFGETEGSASYKYGEPGELVITSKNNPKLQLKVTVVAA